MDVVVVYACTYMAQNVYVTFLVVANSLKSLLKSNHGQNRICKTFSVSFFTLCHAFLIEQLTQVNWKRKVVGSWST